METLNPKVTIPLFINFKESISQHDCQLNTHLNNVLSFTGITTIYSPTRGVSYVQSLHYIRLAYVISILK